MIWNMIFVVCAALGSLGILGFTMLKIPRVLAPSLSNGQHRNVRHINRPIS